MYCVIIAGGSGTRFWPRSREKKSKQFLPIFGKESLIQTTLNRFHRFIPWEDIYIVAKKSQKQEIEKHIQTIPEENILLEPVGKNTAPCIGLASLFVEQRDPDGVVVVSPADHLIRDEKRFENAIKAAVELAGTRDCLVTIGITPSHPATGYGYIQIDEKIGKINKIKTYNVRTFAEKPNLATAQRFLQSGDFLWNSGIFVFRVSVFLKAIEEYLPEMFEGLMEIKQAIQTPRFDSVLNTVYQQIRGISIDYGIMEKVKNVCLVKGDFDWSDLGSWEQVYKLSPKDKNGNTIIGDALLVDSRNSYVCAKNGFVVVLGLEDIIVVQEEGATLICKRDQSEDVKRIVDKLKRMKKKSYL